MIREYALDPVVAACNTNTLQRVFSEFGGENGRIISDVPHQWTECVKRLIQKMGFSTMEKRDCFDELERLKKTGIIKRSAEGLGDDTWIGRAIELNNQEPFQGILTDVAVLGSNQFDYLNMLGNKPDNWLIEQTQMIPRNTHALVSAVAHSLMFAKQVIFVDAYFDPRNDDYRLPFIGFINKLLEGRSPPRKVFIHTCEKQSSNLREKKIRSDIQTGMNDYLKALLPNGFTVELWIWPNNKIHDRFLLTNLVGHAFGHGLNEKDYIDAMEVNINRLSVSARVKEFKKFSTEANRLGNAISVTGTE